MIVIGAAAVYSLVLTGLVLHAIETEEYKTIPLAIIWPIGVPVGIAMVAWAKATPWVRRRRGE